jgi:hypothetical protein
VDNSFTKRPKEMTGNSAAFDVNQPDFAAGVRRALTTAFGRFKSPPKMLARAVDVKVATAKAWLEGRAVPQARHFYRLLLTVPELEAEMRLLTEAQAENDRMAAALRRRQAELEAE